MAQGRKHERYRVKISFYKSEMIAETRLMTIAPTEQEKVSAFVFLEIKPHLQILNILSNFLVCVSIRINEASSLLVWQG